MKAELEKVIDERGWTIKAHRNTARTIRGIYHFHPEIEVTAIVKGAGRRIVGDHVASFDSGDVLLLGSNLPHRYMGGPDSPKGGDSTETVVIQFPPEIFGEAMLRSREGEALRRLLARARRGLWLKRAANSKRAIAEMRKTVEAKGLDKLISLFNVLRVFSESSATAALSSMRYTPLLDMEYSSRISRAFEFVESRFCDTVTQVETAAHVRLSPSAFSRMFSRATGLTFTEYMTKLRLNEASRQLIESDATVAEIALRCGFANQSNFNRQFLRLQRMTPREYRVQIKAAN